MKTKHTKLTASGIAVSNACSFRGMLIGTDSSNDPTITVYDNTAASGNEVIPTATYDASFMGLNGVTLPGDGIECWNGIYVTITLGAGAVEVVIFYS